MSKTALPQHGNAIYPWPLWENGETHTARRGKQFRKISAESFRRILTSRALRRGLKVVTRVSGDRVVFQFRQSE